MIFHLLRIIIFVLIQSRWWKRLHVFVINMKYLWALMRIFVFNCNILFDSRHSDILICNNVRFLVCSLILRIEYQVIEIFDLALEVVNVVFAHQLVSVAI